MSKSKFSDVEQLYDKLMIKSLHGTIDHLQAQLDKQNVNNIEPIERNMYRILVERFF